MSKKYFNFEDDIVFSISRINEHIRFTSGAMGLSSSEGNGTVSSPHIKTYTHWHDDSLSASGSLYQSIFDKDYTSPASNKLFDVAFGASVSSSVIDPAGANFDEKVRIYRQFAQKLLGKPDSPFTFQGVQRNELIFVCVNRNQYKDQIRPGTVDIQTVYSGNVSNDSSEIYDKRFFSDRVAISTIEQTFGGLRGFLNLKNDDPNIQYSIFPTPDDLGRYAGAIYYDLGIFVLIPEVISLTSSYDANYWYVSSSVTGNYDSLVTGSSSYLLDDLLTGVRQRLLQFDFINQSNIRNTFYTCVADRNEFNHSSNPSFVNEFGQIYTTSGSGDRKPTTYISRIGLLGQNNEVIAIGQLNRPVRKDPDLKLEFKVRLDY